jgi:hypothetical protein
MSSIYVHLSDRDRDNSVLRVCGVKDAERNQKPALKVQQCPGYGECNDLASRFCGKCGLPLNQT